MDIYRGVTTTGAWDESGRRSRGSYGIRRISITVTDLEASLAWYQRLLGADRVPMKLPHSEREDTGHGELLIEPRSGVVIGLARERRQ